ncbi:glycosyltransferase [Rhodoplanes sp. Z2-YC6860]|uniref:glycosyltransferase n=1 Tax=Rhodoplanes sp. Z2-YC6860 TaxID=674703 RepID=UPI00078BB303|nr:glycosyltransferase [Rhodoplanes sp. Z2-YC6860]AMN43739.1 glycosyl transferase group 1 [Rhodoplanes sp. Z2-YC6860]
MRILIPVDPELPVPPKMYGGVERVVAGLVAALRIRGHQICLVANAESTCAVDAFYPWPGQRSSNLFDTGRNVYALRNAVGSFQPDIVHSFSRIMYMLPFLTAALPKIMTYGREPTYRTVRLGSILAGGSLSFTGCSEYICLQGRRAGGLWRAVHNFVDTSFYRFRSQVADDAPLVFLSRLDRIKGAHNAIDISKKTGRRLIIAGNHATVGTEHDYWMTEVFPHIGGDIEYIGPVNDEQKNMLLGQAAAMVVPIEWNEPFGIVFAEALACGTPIISRPLGALPEIVRHGTDGFLVRTNQEACDAVMRLGEIDRRNCRARVEEKFSISVIVEEYERLYHERVSVA